MNFISGHSVNSFIFTQILLMQAFIVYSQKDRWNSTGITALESLRMQLFINYDTGDIPMKSATEKTNISLGLSLNYIDINEFNGKLTLYGWMLMRWEDIYRIWNPQSFNNITKLHMYPKNVWIPSVTLLNDATYADNKNVEKSYVILHNNGTFIWAPKVKYTTFCNINLKLWPYDTQYCNVKIVVWSLVEIKANYLDYEYSHSHSLDNENLVKSPKWEVINVKAEYRITETQNYIEYEFQLKRRNSLYSAIIFTPTSSIILLALSTFWLPPQMGEKILLNSMLIVIIVILLIFFGYEVPMMAANTPLVVLFYSSTLVVLSVSIIMAVIVLHISTSKHKHGIGKGLLHMLNGPLGRVLLLTQFNFDNNNQLIVSSRHKELLEEYDNNVTTGENTASDVDNLTNIVQIKKTLSNQVDWTLLAVAIDRLCFIISSITFFILTIIYIF